MIFLAIFILGAVYLAITQNSTKITLKQLYEVEKERQINLPEIYKAFYSDHYHYRHPNLVGSDLFKDDPLIHEYAIELLAADGAEPLNDDDFVFLMHQGYFFYFFKADSNPDPIVYSYLEGRLTKEDNGPFSAFILHYLKDTPGQKNI